MTTTLEALKAAQARTRAELLDPKRIKDRQRAGARNASGHEWRKALFGRRAEGAPRPYASCDVDVPRGKP